MKNNSMRFAVLLMALVLMTSCFVGGTFAKYVTETEGGDNARVAYWGFTAESTTEIDLFDDKYGKIVTAFNGENVIAPGTAKSAEIFFTYAENPSAAFSATAPEVDYKFEITLSGQSETYIISFGPDFKPTATNVSIDEVLKNRLNWTLTAAGETTEYGSFAELSAAVSALAGDNTFDAGELPDFLKNGHDSIEIGWEWPFEENMDADDTALGNEVTPAKAIISLKIVATQIN